MNAIEQLLFSVNFPVVAGGAALLFTAAAIPSSSLISPALTGALGLLGIGLYLIRKYLVDIQKYLQVLQELVGTWWLRQCALHLHIVDQEGVSVVW